MVKTLSGCFAKVDRAKEQIEVLEKETRDILSNNYTILGENRYWEDPKRFVFYVDGPEFPLRISVFVGEIVHNLRSSLDHLVCALALMNSGEYRRSNQFPVCDTYEKFQSSQKRGYLKGVGSEAFKLIQSLQPYYTGDPEKNPLKVLHDLNVMDKHRILIVLVTAIIMGDRLMVSPGDAPASIKMPPARFKYGLHRGSENGCEIQWVEYETDEKNKRFSVENEFSVFLALEKAGAIERPLLIDSLNLLHQSVNKVLIMFKKFDK